MRRRTCQMVCRAMGFMVWAALAGAAAAAELPVNRWTPIGEGNFTPPQDAHYPDLIGYNLVWTPEQEKAVILPTFSKIEADFWEFSLKQPQWIRRNGAAPDGIVLDRYPHNSPQAYCWLPGLNRILYVKEARSYSRQKRPVAGWLVNPADGRWEPIEAELSMSDRSADFNVVPDRDGLRLPIWGTLVYDGYNQEAVLFGGGGTWGRVGKERENVRPGDWIYDEVAGRCRCLTPDDVGTVTEARRWFPAHCGTWTFSETTRTWSPVSQPLGLQPSARILPGMAYDADEQKIVLFGGDDLARCLDDTWIYDCKTRTWTQVHPPVKPRARASHAMVYVPEAKVILMAGGYAGGWNKLADVWAYSVARNEWTLLGTGGTATAGKPTGATQTVGLGLPEATMYASAVYLPREKAVLLAGYPYARNNKTIRTWLLRLDIESAPRLQPGNVAPESAYHCKSIRHATLLPHEWEAGENAPGDSEAGRKELAALPANVWVEHDGPTRSPHREWGHYAYDPHSHKGIAWGGGHSAYAGAEISEYSVLSNHWRSMAQPTNYNPIWLHGMVAGPPGVSLAGWSLLPTHARKSYGYDAISGMYITYVGDVYDPRHHLFTAKIGECPGKYEVATQVSFVSTLHGLYGYSTGMLAKANVRGGKWDIVATGGPPHDEYHHLCYDSRRDRALYFAAKAMEVWAFDFKTRQWTKEEPAGPLPPAMTGDSTYIPEMDAALLIFGERGGNDETMYFYNVAERKWYRGPYEGDKPHRVNTGLNASPHYDPELKLLVRFTSLGSPWISVHVMRLEPDKLVLSPVE